MRHLDLFAGIGGFSLAARKMGWHTVAWCEKDPFCQRVLSHHFPEAVGHGDIKTTDFSQYANRIDLLTGGFPCQPYSTAGQRKGTEDDRHLWPEMLRAIREVRPAWVVGENVSGFANWNGGLVLHEVCAALEAEGYQVQVLDLPALGVDAIHERHRIWIVAHREGQQQREPAEQRLRPQPGHRIGPAANARSHRRGHRENEPVTFGRSCPAAQPGFGSEIRPAAYPLCARWKQQHLAAVADGQGYHAGLSAGVAADPAGKRGREADRAGAPGQCDQTDPPDPWAALYAEPPVYTDYDGFSARLDRSRFPKSCRVPGSYLQRQSIKGAGNAVVPPLVQMIFKAIEETNKRLYE